MAMNDSTKEKILKTSHKLFADKGYNGVSIREIARECDVNLAAINYHFQNKENLYTQTIHQSILETDFEIKRMSDEYKDTTLEKFAVSVFEYFLENAQDLRTSFKLVISADEYSESIGANFEKFRGPPGGEYFFEFISKEVPNASEKDIQWAVRSIFSLTIHKALIMCNGSICKSMNDMGVTEDSLKLDLKRLIKVLMKEITP